MNIILLLSVTSGCLGSQFSFQSSAKVPPRANDELNWFDIGIWNRDGVNVTEKPTVGDSIIADSSNGICNGIPAAVNHFSVYINNATDRYGRVEFLSLFNATSVNCRTVVIIGPNGTLNANSVFIGRGVILFVKGQIIANSIFQEKDSLIQGDGYIFSNSTILEGDIMAGQFYFGLCSPSKSCPNCAPKLQEGVPGKYPWVTGTGIGKNLRFGGSAIVRGTIYGLLSSNQTVSFSTLTVENAVVLIATTEITSISNSSFSYVPVYFQNLVSATVSFQTWLKDVCFPLPESKLPCTFETRWWKQCTNQTTNSSAGICFEDLPGLCEDDSCPPDISIPCQVVQGTPCASKATNGFQFCSLQTPLPAVPHL